MKKYLLLSFIAILCSCSHCNKRVQQPAPAPQPVYEQPQVVYEPAVLPCGCQSAQVEPCNCAYEPDPCREIQKPRIVEENIIEPRRHCPEDSQFLDCGCGQCDTFANQRRNFEPKVETYIPDLPEAYNLAANRVFNRFVRDTFNIYAQNPNIKIYVQNPIAKDADLPGGLTSGAETFKRQIQSSHTFALANTPEEADYILRTTAEWFDTPSKSVPAIKYASELVSKQGIPSGSWVEIVKKAEQTQSWL